MDLTLVDTSLTYPTAERYCRTDVVTFPVGGGLYLVYSKMDGSTHILSAPVVDLLNICGTFKPLGEHAQACYNFLAATQQQPDASAEQFVIGQLEELLRRGLLVPESALRQYYHDHGEPQVNPKISSVGVVTCNRIGGLERCLLSYIENGKRHGRENDFVVADDSQGEGVRGATLNLLRSLKRHYALEISYAGPAEKRVFADALLEESGLPPEVVDFTLFDSEQCGSTIGANRNALLLHTVGDLVLSTDDDIVCNVAPALGLKDGLAFESRGSFIKFWFFPSRQVTLDSVPCVDEDVLSFHERLLGRTLSGCVAQFGRAADLSFELVSTLPVRHLASRKGRVVVTYNGVYGDAGMPSPVMFLTLEAESRERLLGSESAYHTARTSREVLRAVDRACITDNPSCMTGAFGYDNRVLLPPFMPVLRSEDDVFGFTLRSCVEDAYSGHLPAAVLHAPVEARAYGRDFLKESASGTHMYKIILACLSSLQLWRSVSDERLRLQTFGKHLMEVASMPGRDFEEFVRVQLWRMQSDTIAHLEGYMYYCRRSPDFWADDVQYYIHNLRSALTTESFIIPRDLLDGRSPDEARKVSQRLVFKFGQLLYHWPELVEAAKTLRARGRRLAVPV